MVPAGNLDEVEMEFHFIQWMHYTTSCKQCLVYLRMGEIIRPKHFELTGSTSINKPLVLHLVGCLYYCISDARSYKHWMFKRFDTE